MTFLRPGRGGRASGLYNGAQLLYQELCRYHVASSEIRGMLSSRRLRATCGKAPKAAAICAYKVGAHLAAMGRAYGYNVLGSESVAAWAAPVPLASGKARGVLLQDFSGPYGSLSSARIMLEAAAGRRLSWGQDADLLHGQLARCEADLLALEALVGLSDPREAWAIRSRDGRYAVFPDPARPGLVDTVARPEWAAPYFVGVQAREVARLLDESGTLPGAEATELLPPEGAGDWPLSWLCSERGLGLDGLGGAKPYDPVEGWDRLVRNL